MMLIKDIIIKDDVFVDENSSLSHAIDKMSKNSCGVIVALEMDKPKGILTERDILHHINSNLDKSAKISSIYTSSVITVNHNRSVEYGLHILIDNNIRRLVVVDDNGSFVGIVTQESLINYLDEDTFRVNIKISNIVNSQKDTVTVLHDSTLNHSIDMMNKNNIGAIVVVDEKRNPIGILTERNIVNIANGGIDGDVNITEVMSSPIISVDINDNIHDVVKLMEIKNIRRVLVVSEGKLVGIVGTRDIVRNLQGNYGAFLENKLRGIKKTLNYMGESIIEIYDDNSNHVIQWINDKAKDNFGSKILDKEIKHFIKEEVWQKAYNSLKVQGKCEKEKVEILDKYFEMICSYHFNNDIETILIVLRDVTNFEKAVRDEQEKRFKIQKELTLFQDIINQQNSMIAVVSLDGIIITNKAFLDFYAVGSIAEFKDSYECISSTFIAHKDFYSFGDESMDVSWIEDIGKLADTKKVVSIIDISTIEPKAFSVQVNHLQHYGGYSVVTLTDVTDIKLESQKHYYHATHDPLTSLYNRGYYLDKLLNSMDDAKKYNKPFCIVMLDIDHFKNFNDTYGHLKGDEVLVSVASTLSRNVRKDDTVARWGGEEFMVLLPNTKIASAELIAENLRKMVEKIVLLGIDSNITSSFGVSEFIMGIDDDTTLTKRVDDALYNAKENGRNRVEVL
jgi:diguanylate cyclase (GGDEF)-like protein